MKKIVLAIAVLFPVLTVNAGILDDLKDIPASKYEVGKTQLDLGSFILNEKFKGEKIKGTHFKFNKFSIEEEPSKLLFKMSLIGRAKDLTQEICLKMNELTSTIIPKEKIMKDVWSGLSDEQYKSLSEQFLLKTELVSTENPNFKISC